MKFNAPLNWLGFSGLGSGLTLAEISFIGRMDGFGGYLIKRE